MMACNQPKSSDSDNDDSATTTTPSVTGETPASAPSASSAVPSAPEGKNWNLVSLPVTTTTNVSTFLASKDEYKKIDSIWEWDASAVSTGKWNARTETSGAWLVYPKTVGYALLTEIKPNKSYWLRSEETVDLTPDTASTVSYTFAEGWNMVGVSSTSSIAVTDFFKQGNFWNNQCSTDALVASVFGWVDDSWKVYVPANGLSAFNASNNTSYEALTTLTPGMGLMVNALHSTTSSFSNCTSPALARSVQDDVFYFVMPDRFSNGSTSNDMGNLDGGRLDHGFDNTDKAFYHGGDLVGLKSKLDYLEGMGITAIWMTPIFKNQTVQGASGNESAAHHGYWITDYTQIDPHLGTNQELKDLINAAHARDIKIYFDIITNHTADVIKYEQCHNADGSWKSGDTCAYRSLAESATDSYTPFLPVGSENIKVPAWLNDTKYYNNQGDSTFAGENSVYGDFFGLDDLNTKDPEVVSGMVDIFKYWIKDFNIDGFRIDTVKHVNIEFWQQWTPQILAYAAEQGNPNFFMFGEVYDARPSYLSTFTTSGKLPSVLDFGFQGNVRSVFAGTGATNNLRSFFDADDYYTDADSNAQELMNFAGNHDMGRIGSFIQVDSTDDSDADKLSRSQLSHAFMFFARGIPVIYYGSEQGFAEDDSKLEVDPEEVGDQGARENMFASQVDVYNNNKLLGTSATTADENFDQTHPLYTSIKSYSDLYKAHKALRRGKHVSRYSTDAAGIYAFSRVDADEQIEYLIAFNSAKETKAITIDATSASYTKLYPSGDALNAASNQVTLEVPALSFVVYKADTAIAALTEAPAVNITSHSAGDPVTGRVQIDAEVTGASSMALPMFKVVFEAKVGDATTYTTLGEDHTYPYRIYWDTAGIADNSNVTLRAKTVVVSGNSNETTVDIKVDSRVPAEVKISYENGSARTSVYALNHNGRMRGPFTLDGTTEFAIPFAEDDTSLTVVFETYDSANDVFDFDTPLYLTRTDILKNSVDVEGTLVASVFVNNNHEVSKTNNFINSGTPTALTRDDAAANPFGSTDLYLRGSLSGWGASDVMAYNGNHTFKFTKLLEASDVEFKFADADWAAFNFGLPLSASGMSSGGSAGNIQLKVPQNGLYDFYYFHYPVAEQTHSLFRVSPAQGSLGTNLYLRGDFNSWGSGDTHRFGYMGNEVYELTVEVTEAKTYAFKVANATWADGSIFGGTDANSNTVSLDTPLTVLNSAGSENLSVGISTLGTYKFTFDYSDSANPKLTLTLVAAAGGPVLPYGDTGLYLRGTMNEWGVTQAFSYSGESKYSTLVSLAATDYQFKVGDANWTAGTNFGGGDAGSAVTLGTAIALGTGSDLSLTVAEAGIYEFILDASNTTNPSLTVSKANVALIHYKRTDGDYTDWGLHLWNGDNGGLEASEATDWSNPKLFDQVDEFGQYAVIRMSDTTLPFNFIIHKGDTKNSPDDQALDPAQHGLEIWILQDSATIYTDLASANVAAGSVGNLSNAKARMISRDSIAWELGDMTGNSVELYYHPTGGIAITNGAVVVPTGGETIALSFDGTISATKTSNDDKLAYVSYLNDWTRISLANLASATADLQTMLQGQLAIGIKDSSNNLIDATSIQTAGVLDDLYTYTGNLGATYAGVNPTLTLWAPTAKSVGLHVYTDSTSTTEMVGSPFSMEKVMDGTNWTGAWSYTGDSGFDQAFYLYEVEVYVPSTGSVTNNMVTDPYSFSLSTNSLRSQVVDLSAAALKPANWDTTTRPALDAPEDIVLYELHVRDFSISDSTVTEANRGKFKAFTETNSNGINHLTELKAAGLTHVHLLPTFDIATINEDESARVEPTIPNAAADSEDQENAAAAASATDGFNWGYDPFHYTAPEGSYSTNPDGVTRIIEYREMVKSLHDMGLRVVMDVVYNHTNSSGQNDKSVLDKIVPGYYHRLDDGGAVQTSTCCQDTATEHKMMEKLMIDSLTTWATEYQVDAFRFDLMGHHTTANMTAVKNAMDALNAGIYIYGEAWKFGSLDAQATADAAHQQNMTDLGIGSFNDRIRDSARGGTYYPSTDQGFISGLYDDYNEASTNGETTSDLEVQKTKLFNHMDNIRVSLAGNLKTYSFTGANGNAVTGADIDYRGSTGAGFTGDPQENVNYLSAHDNLTLWDNLLAKAPFNTTGRTPTTITVAERVRMQNLGMSLVALGQGIPFYHAGTEILRSKSGDANSYDSGDHFNKLDFSYTTNNWGVGLPPESVSDNKDNWDSIWRARLADTDLQVSNADILSAKAHFIEMLQIRKSSPLFRLRTADEIKNQLTFLNAEAGSSQTPGLIVMSIADSGNLDTSFSKVLVFFNASQNAVNFSHVSLVDAGLTLHTVQQSSADTRIATASYTAGTGTVSVPGRTTLVYTIAD